MNPGDIFWLARYAYNQMAPVMHPAHRFTLTLDFTGPYPGVDIWLYGRDHDTTVSLPYALNCTTKGGVDDFVEKVKALASIPA